VTRNYLSKGVFTGKRPPPSTTLLENINGMLGVIGTWSFPYQHWLLGLIILVLLSAGFVVFWRIKNKNPGTFKIGWSLFLFIWIYMAGLLVAFSSSNLAPVDGQRHYSPLFFPMTLLFLMIIQQLFEHKWVGQTFKPARGVVLCVLVLGLIVPVGQFIHTLITPLVNTDNSFSMYAYWDHPLIAETQIVAERINGYPWASNCKKCLYYAGNQWAVEFYVAPLLKEKKLPIVVVWFKDMPGSEQNPASEAGMKAWLEQVDGPGLNIKLIDQSDRGAIYWVEGKN
jgi:hypothetical protein